MRYDARRKRERNTGCARERERVQNVEVKHSIWDKLHPHACAPVDSDHFRAPKFCSTCCRDLTPGIGVVPCAMHQLRATFYGGGVDYMCIG